MEVYVVIDGPNVRVYDDMDDAIKDSHISARIVNARVITHVVHDLTAAT